MHVTNSVQNDLYIAFPLMLVYTMPPIYPLATTDLIHHLSANTVHIRSIFFLSNLSSWYFFLKHFFNVINNGICFAVHLYYIYLTYATG